MAMGKYLTPRQREIIDDLFDADQDEIQDENEGEKQDKSKFFVKNKLSRVIFNRWLKDSLFMSEIMDRMEWCQKECELILSRNKPKAAKKLVGLAAKATTETARKACIDIINMTGVVGKSVVDADMEKSGEEMAPELAGRVLAAMDTAKRNGDAK